MKLERRKTAERVRAAGRQQLLCDAERERERGWHPGERASKDKRRRHTDPERDLAGKLLVGVLVGRGNPRIMLVGGCVESKTKSKNNLPCCF